MTLDEIADAAARQMFPDDTTTSATLRIVVVEAFKKGYAAGYAEASDRDFGSGYREGLMR